MRRLARIAYPAAAVIAAGFVALAPPASAAATGPATPTNVVATNGSSSITLTWSQPTTGTRPRSFRVYEGGTVVARNTTTHVTVPNLGFFSTHTFTVTALDRAGRESAPTAPVTRTVVFGGPAPQPCPFAPPTGLAATAVTASGVSLSWNPFDPRFVQPAPFLVSGGGQAFQTTLTSARIGGLAPATTYTFTIGRQGCPTPSDGSVTVTTAGGPAARPGPPAGLIVLRRTQTAVGLSWTASHGSDPAARYAVYDGGTLVATSTATSTTARRLWRDTAHRFTVAALDAAGSESVHSGPAAASTLTCETAPPAPAEFSATALSASSVTLSWVEATQPQAFTVFDGSTAVLTTHVPGATVTGLASASTHTFRVVAALPGGCGATPAGSAPAVTTAAGPAARPATPADVKVISVRLSPDIRTGTVVLAWTEPAGADLVQGYRVYEGAKVLATSPTTTATAVLPDSSATTHFVSVTAVDTAGNESPQSALVSFTVPFLPPP